MSHFQKNKKGFMSINRFLNPNFDVQVKCVCAVILASKNGFSPRVYMQNATQKQLSLVTSETC